MLKNFLNFQLGNLIKSSVILFVSTPILIYCLSQNELFFYYKYLFFISLINAVSNSGAIIAFTNKINNNNFSTYFLNSVFFEYCIKTFLLLILSLYYYFFETNPNIFLFFLLLFNSLCTNIYTSINSSFIIIGNSKSSLKYEIVTSLIFPLIFLILNLFYSKFKIIYYTFFITSIINILIDILISIKILNTLHFKFSSEIFKFSLNNITTISFNNLFINFDRIYFVKYMNQDDFLSYNYSKQISNQFKNISGNFYKSFINKIESIFIYKTSKIIYRFYVLSFFVGILMILFLEKFINILTYNKFGNANFFITLMFATILIRIINIQSTLSLLKFELIEKFNKIQRIISILSFIFLCFLTLFFKFKILYIFLIFIFLQNLDILAILFLVSKKYKNHFEFIEYFLLIIYLIFWYVWYYWLR